MEKEKEEKKNRERKRGTYLEKGNFLFLRRLKMEKENEENIWWRRRRMEKETGENVKGPHGPKTFLIGRVVQWVGNCQGLDCWSIGSVAAVSQSLARRLSIIFICQPLV